MSLVPVNVAVVEKRVITTTEVLRNEKHGAPVKVKAVAGGKYILAEGNNGVAPENITVRRDGNDLRVSLEGTNTDEPQLIIEDFFTTPGELVGRGEDGMWHEYVATDGQDNHEAAFLTDGDESALALGSESLNGLDNLTISSGAFSPALIALGALAALAAAVGIGFLAHRNRDDNDDKEPHSVKTPELTSVSDNAGSVQGEIKPGSRTDDTTPTFSGEGTPGDTIEVWDGDEKLGETVVDEEGHWEFTPEPPLESGEHDIIFIGKDPDGNPSEPTDGFEFIVDITAPDKAILSEVQDDVGAIQGAIAENGITDDNRPTFIGKAEPDATVDIIANGEKIGSARTDENGNWSFTPEQIMPDGPYEIILVVTDAAGNTGLPSDPFHFTIDTQPPGKPGNEPGLGGIGDVYDDVAPVEGSVDEEGVTNDKRPELSGDGLEPGDTITIIDNGEVIGSTVVDEDGSWTFTPDEDLADGRHSFEVVVTDPAGNSSAPSDPYPIIIDTRTEKPVITSVVDDQGDRTGNVQPGDTMDDAQPAINGTAEPGSTVLLKDNGVVIGSTTADPGGNWSFTPSLPLTNGGHELTAESVDRAGNVSEPSDPFDFVLDAGGVPAAPAITGVIDDVDGITGNVPPGGLTNDARPTINGTAEAGSNVTVYVDGVAVGTAVADASGQWTLTPGIDLPDGLHDITATSTNAAGNVSPETGKYPVTVDTSAPAASDDETLSDNVGPVTGPVSDGGVTDDSTPTLSGTAEPGSTVTVIDNGTVIGTAPVNDRGEWTFTPTLPLEDGDHHFTTIVEDPAGNRSDESDGIHFIVDTSTVMISIDNATDNEGSVRGAISSGSVTDDSTPALNGRATPDSVVNIYEGTTLLGSTVSDSAGNWSFTPSVPLPEGHHAFTATVVTPAGGESAPTAEFSLDIDLTAPLNDGILDVTDDVGIEQGSIGNGGYTDDNTPTLIGGGQQPGDVVSIIDNGSKIGEAIVDDAGNWEFTPSTPLNDGEHEFTTVVSDPAGNPSAPSDPYTVIVDTSAPLTAAEIRSMGKDSGAASNDFLTNDGSAGRFIQGSLTAALLSNEKVQVSTDGGTTWIDAFVNGTDWSIQDSNAHSSDWSVQTRVIDAAGNIGPVTQQDVVLDVVAPDAPESVERNGNTVTVALPDTNIVAGDMLTLTSGNYIITHVLTTEEVLSGTVDITIDSSVSMSDGIGAFISDRSGNRSDVTATVPFSYTEDFSDQATRLNISSVDTEYFTVSKLSGIMNMGAYQSGQQVPNQLAFGGGVLGNTYSSSALFTLKKDVNKIKYTLYDAGPGANSRIEFYDADGNLIRSKPIVDFTGAYTYTYDAGTQFIHSFKIISNDERAGFRIDNIILSTNDVFTPSEDFKMEQPESYIGNNNSNVFSIDDVALLSNDSMFIQGNGGTDTLKLTGSDQVLDLTTLGSKIQSVETIDLTGSGDNTLKLSLEDVLNQGEVGLFNGNDNVQLMVKGDAGDIVDLSDTLGNTDPGDWAASGQVTVGGTVYHVYQHSELHAEVLIQDGVTTNLI